MRIVIAEDLVLLRDGLVRLLRDHDLEVVGESADAEDFLRKADAHRPDLAVVDVRLPPDFRDEGLRAALDARRRRPELNVLVLSQYVEPVYAAELLADGRGGVGYLLKERVSEVRTFVEAVRRVGAGGTALDPEVVAAMVNPRRAGGGPLSELTPRELEVLGLVAEGRSNAGIAEALVVTPGAVEKHISRIFDKLGLPPSDADHRRVLAVLAYLRGR
jgi:DNA-binding NarL/FixJ family response regulator